MTPAAAQFCADHLPDYFRMQVDCGGGGSGGDRRVTRGGSSRRRVRAPR